jgi:hypothetical protein
MQKWCKGYSLYDTIYYNHQSLCPEEELGTYVVRVYVGLMKLQFIQQNDTI